MPCAARLLFPDTTQGRADRTRYNGWHVGHARIVEKFLWRLEYWDRLDDDVEDATQT